MVNQPIKTNCHLLLGSDPEVLISLNGEIVGSEKAIPEEGILAKRYLPGDNAYAVGDVSIVQDGIQVEFNLAPTPCREWLALEIQQAFRKLHSHLASMEKEGQKFQVNFRQVVEVNASELASLTSQSRRLGCNRSFNWHNPAATITVDPDTYPIRSAGGHLHLGLPPHLMPERERLAPLLDILLGNTAVLIDRDPSAALRREQYGRAGEFRLPRHGFEYRTLSNFWLRSKQLTSLVTGLARMAVYVLDTSVQPPDKDGWPADQALLDLVDLSAIERAINHNDLDLARANFRSIRQFIKRHIPLPFHPQIDKHMVGLNSANLDQFDRFIAGIDSGGIEKWFPEDPMTHWLETHWQGGWESWLDTNCATTKDSGEEKKRVVSL